MFQAVKTSSKGLMRSDRFQSSTEIGELKYLTGLLVLYGLLTSPFVLLPAVIPGTK